MRSVYQEWDGNEFPTQQHLGLFTHFMDYVLEYGDRALEALRDVEDDPEQRRIIDGWLADGVLEKVGVGFHLTPRAISQLQRRALMEVFHGLRPGTAGAHATTDIGSGDEHADGTRKYQFGDALADVSSTATLRNAVRRNGPGVPIRLAEADFETRQREANATCSTVILLDMSGSMSRWHRFPQAKKCAMVLFALIRQRFALDTVDVVGFATGAETVPEHRLPLLVPKRISMFDPEVHVAVPVTELDSAPQHFTNLQLGLRAARSVLARRSGDNKQVFIITDGEPTAHLEADHVHLCYPPEQATAVATLSEAMLLAKRGVRFATFALIDDYAYLDWVGFVDQLTKLTNGIAFYTTSGDLTHCVVESYLTGRRSKSYLA